MAGMAFKGLKGGSLENAETFIRGLLASESFDRQALHGLHVSHASPTLHSSDNNVAYGADAD